MLFCSLQHTEAITFGWTLGYSILTMQLMQNGCCDIYYFSFKCNVLCSYWFITGISASIFSVLHRCQEFYFFSLTMQVFFLKSLYSVLYSLIQDPVHS